jgi:hypothetical protein
MNNNLIALIAATTIATSASAVIDISGTYEGTFTDGGPATYAQDLDLKMVGSVDETSVTILMEDLTGGSAVTANQVFIETKIEGLNFKGGSFKGQNGTGLLQAKTPVANQMELGFDIAGNGVTLGQVSGNGQVSVDASAEFAGVGVKVQNATQSNRFVTAVTNFFGFGVTAETQNTTVGRNNAVSANAKVSTGATSSMSVTGVMIDVNDATVVTQDDGVFGDISDTTNGNTVIGGVVEVASSFGAVTGSVWEKNDLNNYKAELDRGVMNYSYQKNESTDGVFAAKMNVTF